MVSYDDREYFLFQIIKYMPSFFKKEEKKKNPEDKKQPKEIETEKPVYKINYQKERLISNYISTIGTYLNRRMNPTTNHKISVTPPRSFMVSPCTLWGGCGPYSIVWLAGRWGARYGIPWAHDTQAHPSINLLLERAF